MIIASLQLAPNKRFSSKKRSTVRDFIAAEKLLLAEIDRDPRSARAARLLSYAGTVYFLNQDYMNAAVAWKKSEAIAPLDPKLRFSLAMAYIRMAHPDWARPGARIAGRTELEKKRFTPIGSAASIMMARIQTRDPQLSACHRAGSAHGARL